MHEQSWQLCPWRMGMVALLICGCSSGKSTPRPCETYEDCPSGQYCSPEKRCAVDCTSDEQCPSGSCNSIGQCEQESPDGGVDTGPLPDLPQTDTTPVVDLPPHLDVLPWPDAGQPDTSVNDLTVDAPPAPDAFIMPDIQVPDGLPALPCSDVIGQPCTLTGFECGSQATCLVTDFDMIRGVCTCSCIPDDPATSTINEDTCPNAGQNICGDLEMSDGTAKNYCFKLCNPAIGTSTCAGALSCAPSSGSYFGMWGKAVCAFYGCEQDLDCPVITSTTCDTASPAQGCAAGESCLSIASTSSDGLCAKPGNCDPASGLCASHTLGKSTAQVGDACNDDTDCAGNMRCWFEIDWAAYKRKTGLPCNDDSQCCSNLCVNGSCTQGICTVENRNGYCVIPGCTFGSTLTDRACPAGSTCNHIYRGGVCQLSCDLSSNTDCRGNPADRLGDYECRAWDNLTISGFQLAAGPVCDIGVDLPCNAFQATTITCADLGDLSSTTLPNPTNMTCRSLSNSMLTAYDPTGFCLDDTPSSTQLRNPMPTP